MCKSLKNPKTASSFFVPVYNCDSYLHYATAIVQFALYSVSAFTRFMRLSHVSHVCLSFLAESVFGLSHLLSFNISKRTNVSSSSLSHDTFDFCRKNSSISKVKQGKTIGYCVHIFPTWNMGSVPTQLANFNAQLA